MVKQGTPVETVMAAIFGVVMAGSFVEMGVSRILPFVKRLITPLVTGIVVLLIGLTLIKVGLISMGGGFGAMAKGTFASAENLTLSGLVLGTIILLNRVPIVWVRSTALVIALVIGYLAAAFLGRLDFTGMHQAALFQVPTPLHFGIGFVGAVRADADHLPRHVARGDRRRHGHQQDLERAGRRPGVDAADQGRRARERRELAAGRRVQHVPGSVFAQNNGVIQITGVASRYVGIWIAGMLVVLGLFPVVAGVLQAVPEPCSAARRW